MVYGPALSLLPLPPPHFQEAESPAQFGRLPINLQPLQAELLHLPGWVEKQGREK